MDPILNELSLPVPAEGASLEERMREVVAIVRALVALGAGRVLRTTRGALDEPLEGEGSLRKWIARRDQNREARQFLLSVMTKAPYVEDTLARLEEVRGMLWEVTWNGKAAPGLAAACLDPGIAISLAGHAEFTRAVRLLVLSVSNDGTELLEERTIHHFVSTAQVAEAKALLTETILATVTSGADLWRRRRELFPELDFCARVEKDLEDLTGNEPQFPEICRHLAVFAETARQWTSGEFDPPLDWSHESKTTLNDGKYGPMRDFVCPDGEERRFSCHSKLKAQNVRIFFFPDGTRRRVWVGYVGKKIPTVEYPT